MFAPARKLTFQSLFCWTAKSNFFAPLFFLQKYVFQSLFCWTAKSNLLARYNSETRTIRFNPCFVGQQNQTCLTFYQSISRRCFNPCFVGQQNQTLYIQNSYDGSSSGFNPCFVGQQNQTCPNLSTTSFKKLSFNPCFVGQQNQTKNDVPYDILFWKFQSLFCWTAKSNFFTLPIHILLGKKFQSLFCWTAKSNTELLTPTWVGSRVSILVLLDSKIKRQTP